MSSKKAGGSIANETGNIFDTAGDICKQIDNNLLGVFNMGEFTKWVNLGNL